MTRNHSGNLEAAISNAGEKKLVRFDGSNVALAATGPMSLVKATLNLIASLFGHDWPGV